MPACEYTHTETHTHTAIISTGKHTLVRFSTVTLILFPLLLTKELHIASQFSCKRTGNWTCVGTSEQLYRACLATAMVAATDVTTEFPPRHTQLGGDGETEILDVLSVFRVIYPTAEWAQLLVLMSFPQLLHSLKIIWAEPALLIETLTHTT